jgi:hypothetical protein
MFGILISVIALRVWIRFSRTAISLVAPHPKYIAPALGWFNIYNTRATEDSPSWNTISITLFLVNRDNREKPLVLQILYTVRMKMSDSKINRATHASATPAFREGYNINLHANVNYWRAALQWLLSKRTERGRERRTLLLYMSHSSQLPGKWSHYLRNVQRFPPRKGSIDVLVQKSTWIHTQAPTARAKPTIIIQVSKRLLKP